MWRRLALLPMWRQLKPVMLAARVIGPTCFLCVCDLLAHIHSTPAAGLIERILVTTTVVWVSALAIELIAASHPPFT